MGSKAPEPSLMEMMWETDGSIPTWVGQSKTEPFDVREFLVSREAPADNAAPLYFQAMAVVGPEMYRSGPPSWPWHVQTPAWEKAKALEADIRRLAYVERLRAGQIPSADVARVLESARPAIEALAGAQEKPACVFVTGLGISTLVPHISSAQGWVRLSTLELHQARLNGDISAAESAIARTLRLSRDLRPRGFGVCQRVANAIDADLIDSIEGITLGQPQCDSAACDRLVALLVAHEEAIAPWRLEGMRMEYLALRALIDQFKSQKLSKDDTSILEQIYSQAQRSAFAKTDLDAEVAALDQVFAAVLRNADLPYREAITETSVKDALARYPADRFPILHAVVTADQQKQQIEGAARRATKVAGLECLLALRRYYAVHNGPPADLAAACSEAGLTAVPTDAFSGEPMRFTMNGQVPVVYSVGTDLKDDGGTQDSKGKNEPGDWLFFFRG
jgi:hypothetical protein